MMEQIVHLLGGRVAEKLTLNDISTGASNDIERATEIARGMVTKYGFSERLGPVNYSSSDEVFLGKDFSTRKNYSEEMASEIDEEIRTIIEDAYATAEKLLTENIDKLHTVAKTLLEIETLDGEQFEALFTGAKTSKQLIEEVHHMEKAIEEANALEAAQDLEADEEDTESSDEGEYLDEASEDGGSDEIPPEEKK
jgi:cell division protease FtsH